MVTKTWLAALGIIFVTAHPVIAQDSDCGDVCIANVNGTSCAQAEFSCLCKNTQYLENVDTCAKQSCAKPDYDGTITALAQICAIFNETIAISPYATATLGTQNPIISTFGLTTSLPTVSSSAGSGVTSLSVVGVSSDIAGTSIATITKTGAATASSSAGGAAGTSSLTPTNMAQNSNLDLRSALMQGIALALLGFAAYL